MRQRLSRFHPWVLGFVAVLLVVGSGGLRVAQGFQPEPTASDGPTINQPLQPLPTEDDGPQLDPTIQIPPIQLPTLTPVPTRPPRVTPTPTAEAIEPQPPVDAQPTATTMPLPPAPPPTTLPNTQQTPPVSSPFQVGTLTATTRLCPTDFDLVNGPWDVDALQQQCTEALYFAGHGLQKQLGDQSYLYQHEYDGAGASFTVTPGYRWLMGFLQSPSPGATGFQNLTVTCITSPDTEAEFPVLVGPFIKAMVEIKAKQTTSCTRYVYLPVETGNLTVHAWQCPAAYDWTATTADPAADCTQPADGILFRPHPVDSFKPYTYSGHSGDTGPGTVTIPTMIPGAYKVYSRFEPFGSHTDWHFLGACGANPVVVVDWDFSPGSAWTPNAVVPSGGTAACQVYVVPPAGSGQAPPIGYAASPFRKDGFE